MKKTTLLNDCSFHINPGEFIGVLGPSGAGKSTLLKVLTGQIAHTSGALLFNGLPFRTYYQALRSAIGFVAQENLLHNELTVGETFSQQSILRLPRDSLKVERSERIRETLSFLDITHCAGRQVSSLSGGEAKRVHLGIELLSSPALIFLDEPLAGLDFGLIRKFMLLFRRICDEGHTVVLTTHTLEQIELCNRIFFLHNGKLLFQESPDNIRHRFGVTDLSDVYEKAKDIPSVHESSSGSAATHTSPVSDALPQTLPGKNNRMKTVRNISVVRQLTVLIPRYIKITIRDPRTALLTIAQAPIIAVLLAYVYGAETDFFPLSFYFCITVTTIWLGGINAIREIAREWNILYREYRCGLSRGAYGIAKIFTTGILAVGEALLFGVALDCVFLNFSLSIENAVLFLAGSIGGALLGLCISAWSPSVKGALSVFPLLFIPQIFFSGILLPFDRMGEVGKTLSFMTLSRPVFSLFKKVCFLNRPLWFHEEWGWLFYLNGGLIILLFTGIVFHIRKRNYTTN
jgi:ABC-type multidrug transport system ATPase subunit